MNAQQILTQAAQALVRDVVAGRIRFLRRDKDNTVYGIWCLSVPSVQVEEVKGDNMFLENAYLSLFCTTENHAGRIGDLECQELVKKFQNDEYVNVDGGRRGGHDYLLKDFVLGG